MLSETILKYAKEGYIVNIWYDQDFGMYGIYVVDQRTNKHVASSIEEKTVTEWDAPECLRRSVIVDQMLCNIIEQSVSKLNVVYTRLKQAAQLKKELKEKE